MITFQGHKFSKKDDCIWGNFEMNLLIEEIKEIIKVDHKEEFSSSISDVMVRRLDYDFFLFEIDQSCER